MQKNQVIALETIFLTELLRAMLLNEDEIHTITEAVAGIIERSYTAADYTNPVAVKIAEGQFR